MNRTKQLYLGLGIQIRRFNSPLPLNDDNSNDDFKSPTKTFLPLFPQLMICIQSNAKRYATGKELDSYTKEH